MAEEYDAVIVGAGPAGLSAALTCSYFKLKIVVIEAISSGGALSHVYPWKEVESFLGLKGLKGRDISDMITKHARDEGAQIRECEQVTEIILGETITVKTDKSKYKTKTLILCIGTAGTPRKLGIKGEELNCVCYSVQDPGSMKGKCVLVVGGGDSAAECALGLEKAGAKVYMAHRKEELRCMDDFKKRLEKSSVEMLWNTELAEIGGKKYVESARLANNKTGKENWMDFSHIFIFIGSVVDFDFLKKTKVNMNGDYISVDADMKTNVKGIFAAGDITGGLKRIPQSIAQGEKAAYSAYKYIKKPYWG